MNGNISSIIIIIFWPCHVASRIVFPGPGIEPRPQQWKRGVLTTGPPANSQYYYYYLTILYTWFPSIKQSRSLPGSSQARLFLPGRPSFHLIGGDGGGTQARSPQEEAKTDSGTRKPFGQVGRRGQATEWFLFFFFIIKLGYFFIYNFLRLLSIYSY